MAEKKNSENTNQEDLVLSWKWYAKTFSIIVVIILILLYGVYSPIMNHYSNKHIKFASLLKERLQDIKKNPSFYEQEARKWFAYSEVVDSNATKFRKPNYYIRPKDGYKSKTAQDVINNISNTYISWLNEIIDASDKIKKEIAVDSYSAVLKTELNKLFTTIEDLRQNRNEFVAYLKKARQANKIKATKIDALWSTGYFITGDLNEQVKRFAAYWDYDRCVDIIIDEYNMALAYNRRNIQAHYELGMLYIDIEQYEEGYKELSKVVKYKPHSKLAQKVISYLEDVVKNQPKNLEAMYYLGMSKLYIKQKDAAINLFEKIKSTDPKSYMAFEANMRLVELFPKQDFDNDGLPNGKELKLFTEPLNPDTDGDGVYDGADKDPLDPEVR